MSATLQPASCRPLPVDRSEVDAAFVTAALRESGFLPPTAEVAQLVQEPFGTGIALAGQLTLLRMTYAGCGDTSAAPATAVLKLPTEAPENRALHQQYRTYPREARFYAGLAPRLPARTPRCYWAGIDDEAVTSLLLLEDLTAWAPGCQVTGAGAAAAGRVVEALAAVHAPQWDRRPGDDWLGALDEGVWLATGGFYRMLWVPFAERFGHLLPPGALAVGPRIAEQFDEIQRAAVAQAPLTVCHGDCRLDNMLFARGPEADGCPGGVAFVDWQIMHRGPAAEDLATFLTQSLPVDVRRAHEAALVRRWHAALAARIGPPAEAYPAELAYAHYRRLAMYSTLFPVFVGGSLDMGNERGLALTTNMAVRAFTAVVDLDSAEFLRGPGA